MQIECGSVSDLDTGGGGWFVGFGAHLAGAGLREMAASRLATGVSVKWMHHPVGDPRGLDKPPSSGRSLSLVVGAGGLFRAEFAPTAEFLPAETRVFRLRRLGDYLLWGAGIHHRWFVEREITILTLRWVPRGEEWAG
jgi:hypothetical protein